MMALAVTLFASSFAIPSPLHSSVSDTLLHRRRITHSLGAFTSGLNDRRRLKVSVKDATGAIFHTDALPPRFLRDPLLRLSLARPKDQLGATM